MNAARVINNLFAMARRTGQLVACFHEQRLGVSADGTPQYGTPTAFDAMWLAERDRAKVPEGETVTIAGRLWVPSAYPMKEQDRVTLPDGSQATIQSINADAYGTAFTHFEVVL